VVQEGPRLGLDLDRFAAAHHVQPVHRPQRRLGLTFGGAEAGEVVMPDQMLRRLVHRRGVERP